MNYRNIVGSFLLVIALLVPLFSSQTVLAAPDGGTLTGRVVDQNGNGIAGAQVLSHDGINAPVTTLTNESGYYTLSGVFPGANHLQTRSGSLAFSHYWNFAVATGGSYANINITLRPGGGSISGRVIDSAGNGIAGAAVNAFEKTGLGAAGFDNGAWGTTTSDANGNYTINITNTPGPGLPSGTFVVKASKAGLPEIVADNVRVSAGQATANITLVISSGAGKITGQITNAASGAGIEGAQVYVDNGKVQVSAFTGSNGGYTVSNLPSGGYNVVIWKSGFANAHRYSVQVIDGQTTANVNFPLTTQIGSVTGRVTNGSGQPIAGANLLADSLQGTGFSSAITNGNGEYELIGLAPMQYYVHAEAPGYPGFMVLVPVAAGQTTAGINFSLTAASGGISGRVLKDGQPASNATVWINSSTGGSQMFYKSGHTDGNGYYSLIGLPDGQYDVHIFDVPNYTNQVRFYVSVGKSVVSGVDFNLTNGTSFISGYVRNVNGQPVANAQVDVFLLQNPGVWASVFTNSDGYYIAGGLWVGNYSVFANHKDYPEVSRTNMPVPSGGAQIDLVMGLSRALVTNPPQVQILVVGNTYSYAIVHLDVSSGVRTTWSATSAENWLLLGTSGDGSSASGSTGDQVVLRFDPTKVSYGKYQTTLTFTAPDAQSVTIEVVLVKVQQAERIYIPIMNQ